MSSAGTDAMGNVIAISEYDSTLGRLVLGDVRGRLCLCDWAGSGCFDRNVRRVMRHLGATMAEGDTPLLDRTRLELDEYFAGRRREFDLPLLLAGTDFQLRVWDVLRAIPYGHTMTYAAQSGRVGMPSAVRAVAAADGANGLSIIVPCHRIVGSDGSLTGYAGGVDAKRRLLELEGAILPLD